MVHIQITLPTIMSLPTRPYRISNDTFDEFNRKYKTSHEEYKMWRQGRNPHTKRDITVGGRTHRKLGETFSTYGKSWGRLALIDQSQYKEETARLQQEKTIRSSFI